jgi:hypothetical protein
MPTLQSHNFIRAAVLALVLAITFIATLEFYWRSRGFVATHNDDEVLWAIKRTEVYKQNATVFIGGSRIKFDLDVPTWETLTGNEVVQLAIVGTPARPTLLDLANDVKFKGRVVIDIMEPQFFRIDTMRSEGSAREALDFYYHQTPAQKVSGYVNYVLESQFAFLEEGKFSITPLINDLPIPSRPGVFVFPPFPKEFELTTSERQTYMAKEFLTDTALQNIQRNIWRRLIVSRVDSSSAIKGDDLENFLAGIKKSIDKIRARGGSVVFVRPPSSGLLLEIENKFFPRDKYWNLLLKYTKAPGVHFADYPATDNFNCPEWSHLSSVDAVTYTETLVKALNQEVGWTFPNFSASVSSTIKP